MSVEVLVNEHHVSQWFFNPDSRDRTLRIPPTWLNVSGANFVTFRIYNPHTGRDLGFNATELRPLGFALSSMCWRGAGADVGK